MKRACSIYQLEHTAKLDVPDGEESSHPPFQSLELRFCPVFIVNTLVRSSNDLGARGNFVH